MEDIVLLLLAKEGASTRPGVQRKCILMGTTKRNKSHPKSTKQCFLLEKRDRLGKSRWSVCPSLPTYNNLIFPSYQELGFNLPFFILNTFTEHPTATFWCEVTVPLKLQSDCTANISGAHPLWDKKEHKLLQVLDKTLSYSHGQGHSCGHRLTGVSCSASSITLTRNTSDPALLWAKAKGKQKLSSFTGGYPGERPPDHKPSQKSPLTSQKAQIHIELHVGSFPLSALQSRCCGTDQCSCSSR